MGRGSSKLSGGGGGAMAGGQQTDEQKFIADMVESMTRTIGPDDTPMSNSDLESAVEAFAMTHPGTDEDGVLDAIRSAVYIREDSDYAISSASAAAQVAPAPVPKSAVNVATSEFVRAHGTEPRGTGTWAFDIGGRQVFFSGKYADAKKQAIAQAASKGIRQIMTLS